MTGVPHAPAGFPAAQQAGRAQHRAAQPDLSVWVAASAGTGKTKVLTDRVLTLLLHGTRPERILCLTFTKAAAAEMANRLNTRLADWAVAEDAALAKDLAALLGADPPEETLAHARRLFARVLDAAGGMKILTLHAFCQGLLQRFPLEAGVPPHFAIADDRTAGELLEDARDAVLSGAGRDAVLGEALSVVTAHAEETRFADLLGQLASARGRLRRLFEAQGGLDGAVAALRAALGLAPGDTEEALRDSAGAAGACDEEGLLSAVAALARGGKSDTSRAEVLAAWLTADAAGRRARYDDHLAVFLTAEGAVRARLATKAALAVDPCVAGILQAEAVRLEALCARVHTASVAEATAALLTLADALLDAYAAAKRARGLLDYDDLIQETRRLLTRPGLAPWVLFKLDGGLDHVLLDEAQDTSPEQWVVVQALVGEFFAGEGGRPEIRTVFAVGDAKQSIFSFQGADLQGYAAAREALRAAAAAAQQSFEAVPLTVSFRSTQAVLDVVDAVFEAERARDGVVEPGESLRHQAFRAGSAGLVELWPPAEPAPAETGDPWEAPGSPDPRSGSGGGAAGMVATAPADRVARLIAARIRHWTAPENRDDPECRLPARGRQIRPGDVMVLVRRRTAFVGALVRALKELGVPVAGVDRMALTQQLAVMDLIALGQVLLLPEDDLTLATVLKGPLIGLDEAQLFDLAHGRAGARLWSVLRRRAGDSPAYARARAYLGDLMARSDMVRPFELYAEVLGARGGRAALTGRLGAEAEDPIDEFLGLALAYERENAPSLQGFLHWVTASDVEVKRDFEHAGTDQVRVITAHGAKGLQAPVVILADTLSLPGRLPSLLWLGEADSAPPVWLPRAPLARGPVLAAREAVKAAQLREYRRLLYVALTRAEDRLCITGWRGRGAADPGETWYALVEAGLRRCVAAGAAAESECDTEPLLAARGWAGQGWSGTGLRLATPQGVPPHDRALAPDDLAPEEAVGLPPPWLQEPAPEEPDPPRPLAPSRAADPEPAAASPAAAGAPRRYRRGRLLHRLLQTLPDLEPGTRAAAARRFLAQPGHGLEPAEREALASEALALLEAPGLAPLFGPGSRAEVPLAGLISARDGGRRAVSGQVDRLVVRSEGVWFVDYKTNRPPPQSLEAVPAAYLRQMAAYRALLVRLWPSRPVHGALIWTDGARAMPLPDALLDAHAP